jgi:uncharacterized SAM-binding protein YcdF (DUF218 family)
MERKTVVVVLGAPLRADGTPGPDLTLRLEEALVVAGTGQLVVVTGGAPLSYGSSGVRPEAQAGADFLVARGKAREEILVEAAAQQTFDNALLTRALLKQRPDWNEPVRLLVITHDWHVPRSRKCFEAVYGRDAHVDVCFHAVPSDAEDPAVKERKKTEADILGWKWVERKAEEHKNHLGML